MSQQVEESLQKEMEKAIEEKNKELETQLTEQKAKLDKVGVRIWPSGKLLFECQKIAKNL